MKKRIIKKYKDCPRCHGTGWVEDMSNMGILDGVFCAFLGGTSKRCNVCKGDGRVVESEEIIEE